MYLNNIILNNDCLVELTKLPDNSIDSCVTDPPYGLSKEPNIVEVLTKWINGEPYNHGHGGFMGKAWDSFVPHPDIWREVFRVLKPGGHILCFAGTRTQDLMTIALRLAGFEIRDVIEWLYFSGFPKSMDVGKAFDKRAGAEREVIGQRKISSSDIGQSSGWNHLDTSKGIYNYTAPTTPLAQQWDGWGTALKPAHEPIIMARKPLEKTVAYNVEKYGTGAVNVDGCRIITDEKLVRPNVQRFDNTILGKGLGAGVQKEPDGGRFPANCITTDDGEFYSKYFNITPAELSKKASKKDRNSDWNGEEINLPLRDKTPDKGSTFKTTDINGSGKLTNGTGKVAPIRNHHPTIKPVDLMAWLVRLITPPGGIVLDPFAGSGSTLVACKREGFNYVGIEKEAEYVEIINARLGVEAI